MTKDDKTQQRISVILQVLSGQMTATEAARTLDISRKSYHQWQQKSLAAMKAALTDGAPGRPPLAIDPQQEQLVEQVKELSNQLELARFALEVRRIMTDYQEQQKSPGGVLEKQSKKKRRKRKS